MKTNMVSYTRETLPPITEERRAQLRALAERPDSEIDFSDIPELTDEQLKNAVRGRFYRPSRNKSPPVSTPMSSTGSRNKAKATNPA